MAIDGIGNRIGKGGATPPTASPAVSKPVDIESRFDVPKTGAAAGGGIEGGVDAIHATGLEQLRRGEIDIHGYLDQKVDAAMSHLSGLSEVDLTAVRKMLRDQLASDPVLTDLVERSTGRGAPPQED